MKFMALFGLHFNAALLTAVIGGLLLVGCSAPSETGSLPTRPAETYKENNGTAGIPELDDLREEDGAVIDLLSQTEGLVLMWLHSERNDIGGDSVLRQVLTENLMLVAISLRTENGETVFDVTEQLPMLFTLTDIAIPPVADDELSPVAAGFAAIMRQAFQKEFRVDDGGNLLHVFWGQAVRVCEAGGFKVRLSDREYVIRTPLKACPASKTKPTMAQGVLKSISPG